MRINTVVSIVALALMTSACAGGGRPGFDDDTREAQDAQEGPAPPRAQLFISPSGKPFRGPLSQPYPVAAWFAEADRDHDGKVSREEFRADADAWFPALDVNKDGEISMPEVTRWEDELVPEITRPTFGGYAGGRGGPLRRNEIDTRAQGAATYSMINEPHPIRGADADFSLRVSKAEWRAAADRRFDLLDADKDGALVAAALPRTPAQGSRDPKPPRRPSPR